MTTAELTINDLAQRVGMTVRNVRAHQSRGLLPAPQLRGRTGYYGREHVARLELVKDLQAQGFNLEAIRRILERAPNSGIAELVSFTRALADAFGDEEPEVTDSAALAAGWGDQVTPKLVARLEKAGFLRALGEGRWEVRSPRLNRASEELAALGVPLETAVEVAITLRRQLEAVSRAYVKLFLEHVWRPFEDDGEPEERWPEVREALDRLRPLAGESLVAVFSLAMTAEVERALGRELARPTTQPGQRRRRRR